MLSLYRTVNVKSSIIRQSRFNVYATKKRTLEPVLFEDGPIERMRNLYFLSIREITLSLTRSILHLHNCDARISFKIRRKGILKKLLNFRTAQKRTSK